MILLLIACVLLGVAGKVSYDAGKAKYELHSRVKAKKLAEAEHKDLSLVSQEIMKDWNKIPAEHRPSVDIKGALLALDKTFGISDLNSHFGYLGSRRRSRFSYVHLNDAENFFNSWSCDCKSGGYYDWDDEWYESEVRDCDYQKFHDLHDQFIGLIADLREQERVLELAENSHGFDTVSEITLAIGESRKVVTEVTKEVSARVESYGV